MTEFREGKTKGNVKEPPKNLERPDGAPPSQKPKESKKVEKIRTILKEAERWTDTQIMPLDLIILGALKDIRRVVGK